MKYLVVLLFLVGCVHVPFDLVEHVRGCMGQVAPFTNECELADLNSSGSVNITDWILLMGIVN